MFGIVGRSKSFAKGKKRHGVDLEDNSLSCLARLNWDKHVVPGLRVLLSHNSAETSVKRGMFLIVDVRGMDRTT